MRFGEVSKKSCWKEATLERNCFWWGKSPVELKNVVQDCGHLKLTLLQASKLPNNHLWNFRKMRDSSWKAATQCPVGFSMRLSSKKAKSSEAAATSSHWVARARLGMLVFSLKVFSKRFWEIFRVCRFFEVAFYSRFPPWFEREKLDEDQLFSCFATSVGRSL